MQQKSETSVNIMNIQKYNIHSVLIGSCVFSFCMHVYTQRPSCNMVKVLLIITSCKKAFDHVVSVLVTLDIIFTVFINLRYSYHTYIIKEGAGSSVESLGGLFPFFHLTSILAV